MGSTALAKLSRLRVSLEAAKTLDEVVDLRDQAAAIVTYAKAIGERTEIVNAAVEGKIRCERKAGAFLSGMAKSTGVRLSGSRRSHDVTAAKLSDVGVTKMQSSRWQRLASFAEEDFDALVEFFNEEGEELTTAAVLRHVAAQSRPAKSKPIAERCGLAGCLERLRIAVGKVYAEWPQEDMETLAAKLRAYADEIEKTGGLRL